MQIFYPSTCSEIDLKVLSILLKNEVLISGLCDRRCNWAGFTTVDQFWCL